MRADLLGDLAAGADRNADDDEVGAFDRCGVGLDHLVDDAELGHALARRGERAVATIARTAPCARAARAIEPPIRPTPISARRLKIGWSRHAAFPRNSASALTTRRFASSVPTIMRSACGSL